MSSRARLLQVAVAVACLAIGGVLGAGAVVLAGSPISPRLSTAAHTDGTTLRGVALDGAGAPGAVGLSGTAGAPGTSGTSSGPAAGAIAYPYFGGTPGIAPDHSIVVTGVGQAELEVDGSNRAAAQRTALAAALADARAQADQVASVAGLTISGVVSVSVSVSPFGIVEPMIGASGSAPGASGSAPGVPVPGANGVTGATGAGGQGSTVTGAATPTQLLGVSVTVEYRIG